MKDTSVSTPHVVYCSTVFVFLAGLLSILDALTDVGGLELSSRFASVKKGDLAMSAERVFAGTYITEVEVRERALAWVPEVMRFADLPEISAANEAQSTDADFVANDDNQPPSELAA